MAFLSIASFRAVWMAVLSSSVQVLIVKVGALHLIETSVDAGLFEMVVVLVVIVEVSEEDLVIGAEEEEAEVEEIEDVVEDLVIGAEEEEAEAEEEEA